MAHSDEEIIAAMDEVGCYDLTSNIIAKIRDLCIVLHKDAESVANEWCAYVHTKKYDIQITSDKLKELELRLTTTQKNHVRPKTPKQNSMVPPIYNASTLETSNLLDSYISRTPSRKIDNLPPVTPENRNFEKGSLNISPFSPVSTSESPLAARNSTFSARYSNRATGGDIVCSFGPSISKEMWKNTNKLNEVQIYPYNKDYSLHKRYPFMFSKLRDQCFVLNDMIEEYEEIFLREKTHFGLQFEEFDHIRLPSPNEINVIGRIFTNGDGKMNSHNIFLEGSFKTSSGQIISLDIESLNLYSFVPGQIIAASGLNTTGRQLTLKTIHPYVYPPFPDSTLDIKGHLDIVVACGPFSTSDSMAYEPLTDLIKYIKNNNPQICILIGPFIDVKVENITQIFIDETAEELFNRQLEMIGSYLSAEPNCPTKFILVPSQHDIHHDNVYPTPPYCLKVKPEFKNRFILYSDPCLVNIDGVVLGITGVDVLFHLAKEELSFQTTIDKMSRLLDIVLSQRNFYPLYPTNLELSMDIEHFERYGKLLNRPHILITPSDLRCFVKNIQGCCCINTEKLAKGMVGGFFGRIRIKEPRNVKYGSIVENIIVEIVRI